jgi:hypothetical protein
MNTTTLWEKYLKQDSETIGRLDNLIWAGRIQNKDVTNLENLRASLLSKFETIQRPGVSQ